MEGYIIYRLAINIRLLLFKLAYSKELVRWHERPSDISQEQSPLTEFKQKFIFRKLTD